MTPLVQERVEVGALDHVEKLALIRVQALVQMGVLVNAKLTVMVVV